VRLYAQLCKPIAKPFETIYDKVITVSFALGTTPVAR
jgi:hypothetical protein